MFTQTDVLPVRDEDGAWVQLDEDGDVRVPFEGALPEALVELLPDHVTRHHDGPIIVTLSAFWRFPSDA